MHCDRIAKVLCPIQFTLGYASRHLSTKFEGGAGNRHCIMIHPALKHAPSDNSAEGIWKPAEGAPSDASLRSRRRAATPSRTPSSPAR